MIILKEVPSTMEIRKLQKLERDLGGYHLSYPSDTDTADAKKELEDILPGEGKVQFGFARRVLIAYLFAKSHNHYKTGNMLWNDLQDGKRIYVGSYN